MAFEGGPGPERPEGSGPPLDPTPSLLDVDGLSRLVDVLLARGFSVVAPVLQDGAIAHRQVSSLAEVARGQRAETAPGRYRVGSTDDGRYFSHTGGAEAWKRWFLPARELVTRGQAGTSAGMADAVVPDARPVALLGVRSCDLAAVAIQDRVLLSRAYVDERYRVRRERAFVAAVACADPASTCFCDSTGTGPVPRRGYDLCLTELLDDQGHRFVVRVGSDRGRDVLHDAHAGTASAADVVAADRVTADAVAGMARRLDVEGLRDLLYANAESPHWDDVAQRCLACANCTLVCPTCFCTGIEDHVDLHGATVERWRVWDSCFGSELTYLHGGSVRSSVSSRYRQWVTHKFASWQDQFGSSGCVGCGRCIVWCPVGIDVTEELAAIRDVDAAHRTVRAAAVARRTSPEG